jgi:hypothetical protein
MLDPNDFVRKDITATLDFSNPSTRAGLTGSASQGNGAVGRTSSVERIKFARRVVDWDSTAPTFLLADRTFTIEMASKRHRPLHTDLLFLAQSGRNLVFEAPA